MEEIETEHELDNEDEEEDLEEGEIPHWQEQVPKYEKKLVGQKNDVVSASVMLQDTFVKEKVLRRKKYAQVQATRNQQDSIQNLQRLRTNELEWWRG
ncbi:hypothetical protein NDU88_005749 [Pleurodeles waltl]|uniref:Uncharacterized protein n=1 Tax=Pleurodeles waltl TaxID=8319 RepID=A0AAV7RML1_PLEWA|nr:hypothetical protein NDU88_005749 [Pleurodeles waltl]